MMMEKLFEYAIFYVPKQKEGKEQEKSILLSKGVQYMLATSDNVVNMKAVREIPEEYVDKLEQINIVVRAF